MLSLTGIITPVSVNELIPRECFCMFYAQRVNLFGMRAVLCLLPATCALYHDVWFFLFNYDITLQTRSIQWGSVFYWRGWGKLYVRISRDTRWYFLGFMGIILDTTIVCKVNPDFCRFVAKLKYPSFSKILSSVLFFRIFLSTQVIIDNTTCSNGEIVS